MRRAIELIKSNFLEKGLTVLVVGHGLASSRMIELLTERPLRKKVYLENAEMCSLTALEEGGFTLGGSCEFGSKKG